MPPQRANILASSVLDSAYTARAISQRRHGSDETLCVKAEYGNIVLENLKFVVKLEEARGVGG